MAVKAQKSQAVSIRKTGGRPSGAWAGKPWRDALRLAALLPIDDERKGKTNLEACALALLRAGKTGDVPALKEIGDRLDGKVPQALQHEGEGGGPITVVIRKFSDD